MLALQVLNFWKFTSYCSLKPLWSGMGEVVPARTSPTLHPPSLPTVHQLSRLALRVKLRVSTVWSMLKYFCISSSSFTWTTRSNNKFTVPLYFSCFILTLPVKIKRKNGIFFYCTNIPSPLQIVTADGCKIYVSMRKAQVAVQTNLKQQKYFTTCTLYWGKFYTWI